MNHELSHAYDHFVKKLDLASNIEHLACSEITAYSRGECSAYFLTSIPFIKRPCVLTRAIKSLQLRLPNAEYNDLRKILIDNYKKCKYP